MKHTFKKIFFPFLAFSFVFITVPPSLSIINKNKNFYFIKEKVEQKIIEEYPQKISFVIRNLSFPYLEVSHQKDKSIPAASLIKLPIMLAAFKAIGEGRISLEEKIVIKKKDIWGGSGIIKAMKLPTSFSFKKLIELMISRSDNTAANKIIDILGFDYINSVCKELKLKNTRLERKLTDFSSRRQGKENYTSAADCAFILLVIYNKKLTTLLNLPSHLKLEEFALSCLKKQVIADRLPLLLPPEVEVAHKTGLERNIVHDVGIVFSKKGNYIICVLTQGIGNFKKAKKIIAEISLIAYNFI